jgi:hypothetical protein
MFTKGQKVICINDHFHRSIVEWADHIPQRGGVYTVDRVVHMIPEAVTYQPGSGLLLEELPNPGNEVCFSAWRFEPYYPEAERQLAEACGRRWEEPVD